MDGDRCALNTVKLREAVSWDDIMILTIALIPLLIILPSVVYLIGKSWPDSIDAREFRQGQS